MPAERPKFKAEYRKLKDGELGARQNRKEYLRERRRELERAKLKKRKEITLEKAEEFFKKRYGVEYTEQLGSLLGQKHNLYPGNTHKSDLETAVASAIQSKERTLFLFPQTGQLFTFYFMRGLIEELRKQEVTNLSARTIVTPQATNDPLKEYSSFRELISQVTKIHTSTTPKKVFIVDLIDSGSTLKKLKNAFIGYNIDLEALEFAEHQPLGKHFLVPGDFINKERDLSLRYQQNPKTIREMLFFMGRFFVHTHMNKRESGENPV